MSTDARQYTERAIMTATPGQLVVMLYDGMIRFFTQGRMALEAGDLGRASERIGRGLAIVTELRCSLDMTQGQIAERLASIYDWCNSEVVDSQMKANIDRLNEVISMLTSLRGAWAEIQHQDRPTVEARRPVMGVNLAG